MKLGVFLNLRDTIEDEMAAAVHRGFTTCQLGCWDEEKFTEEYAGLINAAVQKTGMTITAFWCGWGGPCVWDFYDGPHTLGLVPEAYRYERIKTLMKGSDFAKKIHVSDIITHVGFLPEVPSSTEFFQVVSGLRKVAQYCKENGQYFLFETGQETPVTLRRTIEEIGTGNLGINLDPANLILYGKANPVDALSVFGEYVRGIHAKDGNYPTDGRHLGQETPIGQGMVNFPAFIQKLKEIGYNGALTIEREIEGEEQIKDIMASKKYLEALIGA